MGMEGRSCMSTLYSSLWRDTSEEVEDEDDLEEEEGGGVSNDCVISDQ